MITVLWAMFLSSPVCHVSVFVCVWCWSAYREHDDDEYEFSVSRRRSHIGGNGTEKETQEEADGEEKNFSILLLRG